MRYVHTMIRVTDLEESLDFWVNKVGMVEIRRRDVPEGKFTLVQGIKQITQGLEGNHIPEFGRSNLLAILAILPPVAIVIFFQSWFVKGLTESDK